MDWARYTKDLRRARGILTQAELAEMVGVDPVTVSRWETGRREPDILYRQRLMELAKSRDGKADRAIIAATRHSTGTVQLYEPGGDKVIAASEELCRLQGLSHDEYVAMSWRDHTSETAQIVMNTPVIERMLRQGEITAISTHTYAPSINGSNYYVHGICSPIWFSSGEMAFHLSISVLPNAQFTGPSIDFIVREEV